MALNDRNSNGTVPTSLFSLSTHPRRRLQADLAPVERTLVAEELRAAMAHELNDPLTALMLYLHEIKDAQGASATTEPGTSAGHRLIAMALAETEHICAIVERMGHAFDAPVEVRAAVARGRDAIAAWTRNRATEAKDSALPTFTHDALTPRERDVLSLIVSGESNKGGAHRLGIASRTYEVHRAHIMKKFGAKNVADLVRITLSEVR